MLDISPPPFWRKNMRDKFAGFEGNVDRWQIIHFEAPSTIHIDVGVAKAGTGAPQGDRSQGVNGYVMNTISPESPKSCHYFWSFQRDYRLDSQLITTQLRDGVHGVFGEDEDMLRAQQAPSTPTPTTSSTASTSMRAACGSAVSSNGCSRPRAACRGGRGDLSPGHGRDPFRSLATRARRGVRRADRPIRRIVLEVPRPVKVAAGAHLDVRVRIAGEPDRRSYSIVDASPDGARIAVSVFASPRSRAARRHARPAVGDELDVTQPLLDFPLRLGPPLRARGRGIGITAIAGMARTLRGVGADYTLVYAGRSRTAMAYLDELIAEHGSRLELHIGDEGPRSSSRSSSLRSAPRPSSTCADRFRLMEAVRRAWVDRGLSLPNLRFETFGNSGWFEPQEFVVRIPKFGLETTVGPGESMLEASRRRRRDDVRLPQGRMRALRGAHPRARGSPRPPRRVLQRTREGHHGKMCCCVVTRSRSEGPAPPSSRSRST